MVSLRLQKISDAKRFYEILNNPNFIYYSINPNSINDEIKRLRQNNKQCENNLGYNYTILFNGEIVGSIYVKINYHRRHIGEIVYFLDEKFWNKGIITNAVTLVVGICKKELNLVRLEILVIMNNIASQKIAIKNNFVKEATLHKVLKNRDGKMKDCHLYAKII